MNQEEKQKVLQAGEIASKVKEYAKSFVKKDVSFVEIADKIETSIINLGGKLAFPVNLSANHIAAHYTPSHDDETRAYGLLKIDFGVHIDGWIADTAFSIDLENDEENKKLIESAEKALENATKNLEPNMKLSEIGKTIQETIESYGFSPVINLSGHSIEEYNLHSGITIPNTDDKSNTEFSPGLYAIEPFSTTGNGKVHEGKPSGIYELIDTKSPRSQTARQILNFIIQEYNTIPFCSRWIVKKFGSGSLIALKQLESNGNLHHFSQLIESSHKKVAQAEHTILVEEDKITITTEEIKK